MQTALIAETVPLPPRVTITKISINNYKNSIKMAKWLKITDNSKNGGKIWAWVSVGGTAIGVVGANWQAILNTLASVFGIK